MAKEQVSVPTENTFVLPNTSEIEALKKKYGALHLITVTDKEGNERYAIVRVPKMNDLQIASASEKKKAFTYNLSVYNNCKIVADPEIEANDYLLLGVLEQINELVDIANGFIKKL